jgi:carotenoid cleavage dioxygenase-like enzyme
MILTFVLSIPLVKDSAISYASKRGVTGTFLTRISKIPGIKSQMTLYRMNTISERKEMVTWEIDEPRYIHSFSVTQNYVVILAPPIT